MTSINAYFADVDEKQKAVAVAEAELQAAKDRLEAKKEEDGYVEPEVPKEPESAPAAKEEVAASFQRKR
jgi:hypothetical protein